MEKRFADLLDIKSRRSWAMMLLAVALCLALGFIPVGFSDILPMDRESAYDLVTENLSNFGGFLGIGLAILAIIFTIIQLSYKRLTIIEMVIENTYFIPLFYFGAINIGFSSFLLLLRKADKVLSDFAFSRLAVMESYLFYGFVIGMCVVFYRTLRFINFENILRLYLRQTTRLLQKEKIASLNPIEKERLSEYYLEIIGEAGQLLSERKARIVYAIMEHFRNAIKLNPTSIYLNEYDLDFSKWFMQGIVTSEKHLATLMYEEWDRIFDVCLDETDRTKLGFATRLPMRVFNHYATTKDNDVKQLIKHGVLIRIKEKSVYGFFSLRADGGKPEAAQIILYYDVAETFQELLFQFIRTDERDLLEQTLLELRVGKQFLGADDDFDIYEDPDLILSANRQQDIDWMAHSHLLANYFYEMPFYAFCYLSYTIVENQVPWLEKKPIFDLLMMHLVKRPFSKVVLMAIDMFSLSDGYGKMPLAEWVRRDQLVADGEAHVIENSELVLAVGLLALMVRMNLGDTSLSEKNVQQSEPFVHFLMASITRYQKNERFVELLGARNETEARVMLARIKQYLDTIKSGADDLREKELVKTSLSFQRVEDFRQMIFMQWKEGRQISRLFESLGAVEINPPKEEKLYYVGIHRVNLRGGKSYFIEKRREHFVGDFSFGHRTNDQVLEHFWQVLKQDAAIQKSPCGTLIVGLDFIMEHFPAVTHVICAKGFYQRVHRALADSGHYAQHNDQNGNLSIGVYKNKLQIIPVQHRTNPNEIIGLQLPGAMVLQQRTNDGWLDGKLQVDVLEIDDTNVADTMLRSNPPGDPNDSKQIQAAKTGVIIEVDETMNFKVLNPANIIALSIQHPEA